MVRLFRKANTPDPALPELSQDDCTVLDFAIQQSPMIYYIADRMEPAPGEPETYALTYISPNLERLTGHKPEAFLSDPGQGRRLMHPDDRQARQSVLESLTEEETVSHEYRLEGPDGAYRWYRDDLKLTRCRFTKQLRLVGSMVDVTERKAAEAEQARMSSLLDDALDIVPNGFALYDQDDRLYRCNAAFASLYDVAPEDLIGLESGAIFKRAGAFCNRMTDEAGRDCTAVWRQDLEALRRGPLSRYYEMETEEGHHFLISVRVTSEGTTALVRTDITALKNTEAAERDAQTLKTGIIDSAMDCIIATREDGTIIEFNPAAEQTFGYSRERAIGRSVADLIIPEQFRQAHDEGMERYISTGEKVVLGKRLELRAQRSDGSHFPVEVTVAEIKLDGRRIFTAGLRDITEQKRVRKERKRLIQLLHASIESMPSGFAVFDKAEQLVLCNTAFASLFDDLPEELIGVDRSTLHGRTLAMIESIDGVDLPLGEAADEVGLSKVRAAAQQPVELKLRDGTWVLITGHAMADGGLVEIRTDVTRLKQAEQSLREREQLFRSIVEGQPAPVWMAEANSGRIVYASPAIADLFGTPDDAPVLNARDAYADAADRTALVEALMSTGEVDDYEVQLKRHDGRPIWVSSNSRLFDFDGKRVIISCMLDLTERKQREAELRQARETLEDAIESLSEGFALYDSDDRLVLCNDCYRDLNRESADMLEPGVRWMDFIRAGAERGQYVPAVGRVEEWLEERAALRAQEVEMAQIEQTDGRWFQVSNRRTRQGGYVAIRTDITDLKKMEIALRDSEARFRRMVEEHPLPVLMSRAKDGVIVYESPASRALFGRKTPAGDPETIFDYYVDLEQRTPYLAHLREHGKSEDYELQFHDANGRVFYAAVSSRLIEFQGHEVIVASLQDMTERRAAEQELARQREALYQNEKLTALGSLLAGVAHELNNPLSVVVGQALLLQETAADPKIVKRASKIGLAADRCSRIVRAFLAMARQRPPEKSSVDLNQILRSILDMLGYSLRTADIEVQTDFAADLPPVWGDADQLNQVLVNLVVNAQQAATDGPENGLISVATEYDAGAQKILVRVTDNGPGIADDIRPRIFEPFFTTKDVGDGTGVGLAVSFGIVEAHNGTIRVESEVDRGATFTVSLPAARPDQIAPPQDAVADESTRGCRILIVDDEREIAQTLDEILTADGHRVWTTDSGVVALDMLGTLDLDLILCDLRMPNMDGRRFYEELQRARPELADRIAFVTGDTFGPTAGEFFERTGLPYLEKPFTPGEVRHLVERLANSRPVATDQDLTVLQRG